MLTLAVILGVITLGAVVGLLFVLLRERDKPPAQEILAALTRRRGDFDKLQENFRLVGKHLTNAAGSYTDTEKALVKFDAKFSQVEQPQLEARPQPPEGLKSP